MNEAVGFIGLGAMGWPMATRIAAAGRSLLALDATPDRATALAREQPGITACGTAAEVARGATTVVTMLPTSAIVEAVLFHRADCNRAARRGGYDAAADAPARS